MSDISPTNVLDFPESGSDATQPVGMSDASPTGVSQFPGSEGPSSVGDWSADEFAQPPAGGNALTSWQSLRETIPEDDSESTLPGFFEVTAEGGRYMNQQYRSFEDMGLHDDLVMAIYGHGFNTPSPIHERGIVPFCLGRDVIEHALPGAGRNLIFCLGILHRLDYSNPNECQALVLAPTRDHALQIKKLMKELGRCLGVEVHAIVGGSHIREDRRMLSGGVQVVIGTPGRVLHMWYGGYLKFDSVTMIVVEDAEDIVSRQMEDAIDEIFTKLPPGVHVQVGVFSANVPMEMARRITNDAVWIFAKRDELTVEGIQHFYAKPKPGQEKEEWKFETLCGIYQIYQRESEKRRIVVLVNTSHMIESLALRMLGQNHPVFMIHEKTEPPEIEHIMNVFREDSLTMKMLITSERSLWGEGIDVQEAELVINYELPRESGKYIVRVGRNEQFRGRPRSVINLRGEEGEEAILSEIKQLYSIEKFDEWGVN